MSTQFLSEIRAVSFNFPPKGWAFCNGQTLPIDQNQALFSLLGTTYGGDGIRTFQLPNLQAMMPVHAGNGFTLGQAGGEVNHTLIQPEMPAHNHSAQGVSSNATSPSAEANTWASSSHNPYSTARNTTLSPAALSQTGGSQPHNNMPPCLTLTFIIALQGIYPSRS
ncbi:phage tail protein [Paracidobacterium acidisoli]|uniref:Phage tail protein n=1 Tax=Paracidobacterium acidisoli TaxID=2303751 RepID=A0A372IJX8_9BACT|nr:tail fiber protein [Paracidobacterium acidisoli]MBT9332632.1 tail fiber protein [Paracidobacterium acidisoli]